MSQQVYGLLQLTAIIAQIAYWIGMLLFVGYAVVQYKRWVNYQMGTGRSGQLRQSGSPKPSVEEFVD